MGSHQKKTGKKVHNSCELWGGQQILVCEPQKSAFFRANFPKMLKLIHNVPFVCLTKYNHLIHSRCRVSFMHTSIQNNVRDWLLLFGTGRGGRPPWDQSSHFRIRPRRISDLIENSKIRPCKTSPLQYQILVQRDENFS